MTKTRLTVVALAAGALLALPATSLAAPGGQGKGKGKAQSCAKTQKVGFQVAGTLVAWTADDPAVEGNQATVTLKVTSANSHARKSGELDDVDPATDGLQYKGGEYTVPADDVDGFTLKLNGYAEGETPTVDVDRVKVNGRIARTKKRCLENSGDDRYADPPNIRRVTISDRVEDVVAPV